MSTSQPPVPPASASPGNPPFWQLSRRTWLLVGGAFAIGLLLFLLLWSGKRDNDFFRVAPATSTGTGVEYEPLPAPLPADAGGHSAQATADSNAKAEADTETARILEQAPAPLPPPPVPVAPRVGTATPAATPVPIEMPAPRYPAQAERRGVGGTVRIRADVGTDGIPTEVAVVQGSGTRALDKAALDAVRRWRFRPGQVDGQPVAGSVVVPIEFAARR
ncbi:outer membrane transport energization protein TonB [Luteimonas cucumeris]|uniref:Protein TonB n=1 Tax=Luteimonas cucumeris TaxID=985012 RepID=A0A562L8K9_9GAMM|nr:energy transducer TonB [Luteimonas cucumeris]TWI03915.1 outer membrane transport energization protein TonB [Luteimonas cucumeris]